MLDSYILHLTVFKVLQLTQEEMSTLEGICNNNAKNMPANDVYKSFNDFIFANDIKLVGKLLHRFQFFEKVKHLPGDIVEVGVFKGSGVATFSKFVEIYCPHSNKKIIGFDIFDDGAKESILEKDGAFDKENMMVVYSKVDSNELSLENVQHRLDSMGIDKKYMLIRGDVEVTVPTFVAENPGFRASLIYIDVDLDRPTYASLKHLWDRLLPGGMIVFDEYEYHKFSESCGVEKFLKEKNLSYSVESTNWFAPTAFLKKESF
jgi:hypothetical protein